MFWIGLLSGVFLGANISLIFYAVFFTARQSEKQYEFFNE